MSAFWPPKCAWPTESSPAKLLTFLPVPAKATALKRVGLPAPDAVFGNSIHDLAMLEMARCPFPVNPSPALLEAGAKRGWGYFRPKAAEGVESEVAGESGLLS